MTPFMIYLNIMTYVVMYAIPTKWLELGPWLQLCTLLPSNSWYVCAQILLSKIWDVVKTVFFVVLEGPYMNTTYIIKFCNLTTSAVWARMTNLLISVSKTIFRPLFTVYLQNGHLSPKICAGGVLLSFLSYLGVSGCRGIPNCSYKVIQHQRW